MMKKVLFTIWLVLVSCEEVVEVDLEQSKPKLVVEASLLWNREQQQENPYIILTTTTPYFEEDTSPALNAEVSIFAPDGSEYVFEENEPGVFKNENLLPTSQGLYELVVTYQNEVYRATEQYVKTPALEEVIQEDNKGFMGDETEFKLFFTDPQGEDNFYLFKFFHKKLALQIYNDEFTNGNRTFAFFSEENVQTGEKVGFEIQGISEQFYQYLYLLRSQSGTAGGPFQTQPTVVRGNIINTTNSENFAFGYFRLSETDFHIHTVK